MSVAAGVYRRAFARGLEPEPEYTVSEWADRHRVLTARSSAEPGDWRTDRFPFSREVMDSLSAASPVRRIVFMGGRQISKSEVGLNWIGYVMHHAPGPMLFVEPSVDMAKKTSRQRIAPMIEETPVLRERVPAKRSRDAGNTMFSIEFPGGILMLTGSNSSAALRSTPIRYLFANEADEYSDRVEDKGSALSIAEQCTNNFPNRKIYITGNPGVRGHSRIEKEFYAGDQRRYFIPCPHCGEMDFLTWNGFRDYVTNADGGHHRIGWEEGKPRTACMVCGKCGAKAFEHEKTWILAQGEWRPTLDAAGQPVGDGETRSYHLSSLYSPFGFKSWADCAVEFLKKKNDPVELRSFVNETLGDTFEEESEKVEAHDLMKPGRQERYLARVPEGVGVLVAAIDVQGDRLECKVKGYGAGEESWLIEWTSFLGDPAQPDVWAQADRYVAQEFAHQSGQKVRIEVVTIDSGGHHTDEVYRFCATRRKRRLGRFTQFVRAVKGGHERKLPLVGRPTRHNRYGIPLYVLCTDTGKGAIMARLRLASPGPGYMHFPEGLELEYFEQLTAEKGVWKYVNGATVRVWISQRRENHAFDLEVYCLAALKIKGEQFSKGLGERAQQWARKVEGATPGPSPVEPAGESQPEQPFVPAQVRRPRRKGWMDWRR